MFAANQLMEFHLRKQNDILTAEINTLKLHNSRKGNRFMNYHILPLITEANEITLANSPEMYKELCSNPEAKERGEHE